MKKILLGKIKASKNKDLMALVDDSVYDKLTVYHYHARNRNGQLYYACRNIKVESGKYRIRFLHRDVLNLIGIEIPVGYEVGHKNGNGLDCRLENLQVITHRQNMWNRKKHIRNKSGFKGVVQVGKQRWVAQISPGGEYKYLGTFSSKEEAAIAYNNAATEVWGDHALLNEVP